jgi:hypothetical protein
VHALGDAAGGVHRRRQARAAPAATYGTLVGALSPTTPGAFTPTSGSELGFNATVALDAPAITTVAPTTGDVAGGQQVTITGQHLAVVTGVAFDGVAATISAASNTQLTVVAPPHAGGAAIVTVTTAGGTGVAPTPYVYTGTSTPTTTTTNVDDSRSAVRPHGAGDLAADDRPVLVCGGQHRTAYTADEGRRSVFYRLSEAARTSFTTQRKTTGVRRGSRASSAPGVLTVARARATSPSRAASRTPTQPDRAACASPAGLAGARSQSVATG